jgi:ribosomal protein S18 acetylase RimI-like enzyme
MLELARESDWESVKRLSVQIHDLHATWRPDIYFSCDEPYPKEKFLDDIHNRLVYTARLHGCVMGYVLLSFVQKGGAGTVEKKMLRLESVVVDEAFRRQGIGKQIIADVRALGKAFGCSELILGVHPENDAAVTFYQKCGFFIRTISMDMKL